MKSTTIGNTKFDIKKDTEWDEFCVRCIIDGKRIESRCYYTDDKQDAIDTMSEMVEEEIRNQNI